MPNKVLICSEFSQIGSGYASYTHELINGLHRRGVIVAELASFCRPNDPRIGNCPWQVYPVQPHPRDEQNNNIYNSNPSNVFGKHIFESVLLEYQPTHVIDIRDVWNFVHEFTSPFRPYYSHIIMPAVDSDPQFKTWLELYSKADVVITYCDWAKQLLEKYGLRNILDSATPVPPNVYTPIEDKKQLKESLGLGDVKIIGTVMRNQPRKLFPQLFQTFKRFLDESKRTDIYLYCHTGYPDTWELDEYLLKYNLGHKVLFTYSCMNCHTTESSFYKGPLVYCHKCKDKSLRLPNTFLQIPCGILNQIYNIFDLYIQYSSLEGYGIPVAEAIAAGIPSMVVNYSAMETFVNDGNAIPIDVTEFQIEPESGRRFALPDEKDTVDKLIAFFSASQQEREARANLGRFMYGVRNVEDMLDIWVKAINTSQPSKPWNSPPAQFNPVSNVPDNINNVLYARWLILNVLQEPKLIGSYMESRLVRDLENGFAIAGYDGKYYYEAGGAGGNKHQPFNREIALQHFKSLLEEKQTWENHRTNRLHI